MSAVLTVGARMCRTCAECWSPALPHHSPATSGCQEESLCLQPTQSPVQSLCVSHSVSHPPVWPPLAWLWLRWRGSGWRLSSLLWPSCVAVLPAVFRQSLLSRLPVTEPTPLASTFSYSSRGELQSQRNNSLILGSAVTEESRIFQCMNWARLCHCELSSRSVST